MAGEWNEESLSALADLSGGFAFKSADYAPVGRFILRTLNISDDGSIDREDAVYLPEELCSQYSRFELRPEDALFVMVGATLGKVGFVRKKDLPALLNQNMWLVRARPERATPRFVYYTFRHAVKESLGWASGSARDFVRRDDYRNLKIPAPPLSEQRTTAHILGTLDDKIELNRRMNETLEAMARALFKSWFVDFDPVRAKVEGRDPGLSNQIADLFPDSFEDSELGEIPTGWDVKPLADCVDVARGLSYKGSGLSEGGLPMHNLNSIYEGGGYKLDGLKRYDGDYKSQHIARAGDLIVANTEQGHDRLLIGYAAIVPARFGQHSLFSHHIYRVRPKLESNITADYLCHLLNTSAMHDIVSGYANGTTVNMLPSDGLQSPLIVVPSARAISAFSGIAATARMRHEEMVEESGTLAALRDTLLPRLISGELRVSNAENLATEVY